MATKKNAVNNEKKLADLKDKIFSIVLAYWDDEDADSFDDLHEPLDEIRESYKTDLPLALKALPKKTVSLELTEHQIQLLTSKFERDNLCLSDGLVSHIKASLKAAK